MTHGQFCGCLWFSFAELKKQTIQIFFRNLHLLSFPTIYCQFAIFSFKMAHKQIFSQRTPVKVRSNLHINVVFFYFYYDSHLLTWLSTCFLLSWYIKIWYKCSLSIKFPPSVESPQSSVHCRCSKRALGQRGICWVFLSLVCLLSRVSPRWKEPPVLTDHVCYHNKEDSFGHCPLLWIYFLLRLCFLCWLSIYRLILTWLKNHEYLAFHY